MQTILSGVSTLKCNVESKEECVDPCIISVSGVWSETEMKAIKSICAALYARFYDAETADFIEL